MLRKLIKYDMKTLSRLLILIHIPVPLLAIACRYLGVLRLIQLKDFDAVAIFTLIVGFIYWTFSSLFTQIYVVIYTYRKLFQREGYLTLTLPVSMHTQVLAKLISGSIWILINAALLYLALFAALAVPEVIHGLSADSSEALLLFRLTGTHALGGLMILITLIGSFGNMAMALGAITFGHCFQKNRILISILVYFGGMTVVQTISAMVGALYSIKIQKGSESFTTALSLFDMYRFLFLLISILTVVTGVVCYFFSCYVLNKKVNLD